MMILLSFIKKRNYINWLIFSIVLLVANSSHAQSIHLNKEISINADSIPLDNLLDNIAQQCKCYFTYNSLIIDGSERVSLNIQNTPLHSILDTLIGNSELEYSEYLNQVVISNKKQVATLLSNDNKQNDLRISGKIIDIQSKAPLPFASIAIKSTYIGTICNELGYFSINIPGININDTLLISYVGYYTQKIPLNDISEEIEIGLLQGVVSIQEIVVRSVDPLYIINKIRENRNINYQTKPFNYEAFYREAVIKEADYSLYTEALLNGYKPRMNHNFLSDKIQIIQSRKFSNMKFSDTVSVKIRAGIESCFRLDVIDDFPEFLIEEGKEYYNYSLSDILIWDNSLVYCVDFKQKQGVDEPMLEGVIYVSLNDFAIVGAEFEYSEENIRRYSRMFIVKKSRMVKTKIKGSKYLVRYQKINGKYYLNHVRGELFINVKRKRQIFTKDYTTLIEMVITNIKNEPIKEKPDKNLFIKTNTIFSDSEFIYEQNYWGINNTINPEPDILKAFKKAGLKISESSIIHDKN